MNHLDLISIETPKVASSQIQFPFRCSKSLRENYTGLICTLQLDHSNVVVN